MGGLTTSLLIGVQALEVNQASLAAASNNIANANTAGYTREVPLVSETAEQLNGGRVTGGGVSLDSIQSVRDELLNLRIQQQTSAQSAADTEYGSLQQIENLFASSGGDIGSSFSSLSQSLAQLSANPSNNGAQQGVLSAGQNLAKAFNSTADGLTGARASADQQVTQTVAQINSLSQQIAQLNAQISQATQTASGSGTLQDQRDQLVLDLSKLTSVSVSQSSEGEVITTGNGSPLVLGGKSFALQTTTGADGQQHVLDANGADITSDLRGGQLGGALHMRDQAIPGLLASLNTLATQFAKAFNSAQAKGYDSNGKVGADFFKLPSDPSAAAAGLSVALTDPSQIAISSDGASGSNGNVANLSGVLTSATASGQTPLAAYSGLVYQVGDATANAHAQSTAIGQSILQLTNQQNSVSGVSIDEESTNLIRYQTAYEAAARIVSTVQALTTATLNMIS